MGPNETAAWLAAAKELLEKAIQQGIHVDAGVFAAAMGVAILLGLTSGLLGYRVLRIVLALWGLVIGAVGGAAVGWHYGGQIGALIGALAGGLIAACSVSAFYLSGVFALTALIGAAAGAAFCDANGLPVLTGMIATGVVFGLLGLVFQKLVVVVATSVGGAVLAVVGGYYFQGGLNKGNFVLFGDGQRNKAIEALFLKDTHAAEQALLTYAMENPVVRAFAEHRNTLLLFVAGLSLVGIVIQLSLTARPKKILEAAGQPVG
ncbi:MAG: DUF4203 domain-containing protein [Planctomycetota bacterium]|nr:DUF4203 domain-containing protein [Planctomycetota bacterium]